MDKPLPPQLSGSIPLFPGEDSHQNKFLPAETRPVLRKPTTSNITSLLSARSYPLPESYKKLKTQENWQIPMPDHTSPEPRAYPNQTNKTNPSKTATPHQQKRRRDPDERRRMQIRLAQRTYRSRQQATIKGLEDRISHLENTLDSMSSAVLSFSERLLKSGVLGSHSNLTKDLRDTMKIFISLASEASSSEDMKVPDDSMWTLCSSQSSPKELIRRPSPTLPLPFPLGYTAFHQSKSEVLSDTLNKPGISTVEFFEFINRLHLAALYQGHQVLCNESIDLDQLQRPFGLMLSMMSRDRLASYFKAELHAQVSQQPLEGWEEVPFFNLGSAGTHYIGSSMQGRSAGTPLARYQRWGTVEDPLSLVTADIQKQLEGDWLDLHDLEGFLRDRSVRLLMFADEPREGSSVHTGINIARLIPALISRGVCLGRTPGFQRDDVEKALNFAKMT
ncbi:hypothetical protein N7490_009453 [Penicillium lividum]|nr:hypothetical protein N7490_009453 [Penicillium lividum]